MTGLYSTVPESANIPNYSIQLFQEMLQSVSDGGTSLADALPDLLFCVLQAVGSRDGRLVINESGSKLSLAATVSDGQIESEPKDFKDLGFLLGESNYIHDTLDQPGWWSDSFPHSGKASWSVNVNLIGDHHSPYGFLAVLKSGADQFSRQDLIVSSLFASQIGAMLAARNKHEALQTAQDYAQKLAQDNQDLAAILVHDLQGPLANVLMSLEMAQDSAESQGDPALSSIMEIALRSGQQLKALIDSLLDISRLESGQKISDIRPANLSTIVDFVADVEAPVLEQHQVTLVCDIDPDLPFIAANPAILQRVFLNLIDNALKVSRQDQVITIRATSNKDAGMILIRVLDQGPGIPQSFRERVFEKYQRVHSQSSSKGLGLGLAFCRLAVEAHGGRIWVEDAPSGGACFCFTIPVADTPASG